MNPDSDDELLVRFQKLRQSDRLATPVWRGLARSRAASSAGGPSMLFSWRLLLPLGAGAVAALAFVWQTLSPGGETPSLSAALPELMKPSGAALFAQMDEASPAFPSDFLLPESQRFRLP